MKGIIHIRGERIVMISPSLINDLKTHELGKELYIKNIGFYPRAYYAGHEAGKNDSNDYILIYCMDGKGFVDVENNRYEITRNQILILPLRKTYSYSSDKKDPWSIYWIHFSGEKADFFSKGFDTPVNICNDSILHINERIHLLENIYASLKSSSKINSLLYVTTGFFHFLGTIKFVNEYHEFTTNNMKNMDMVDLAIHYMRDNINRKIKLSEIANHVGLSESYFSALFTKETGSPPLRYLANLRFKQACHYLNSTDMKVNQICPLVGYDDSLYFSRAFAKSMGMSPSEYRITKKGNA